MTEETLFSALLEEKILFVLVGGTALAVYGSERITIDTDIAVRTLDLDKIINLFYSLGLKMVIGVDKNQYPLFADNAGAAIAFSDRSGWGFLKFLSGDLELDVLYDISVPFMRLLHDASTNKVFEIEIKTASLSHLRAMKEKSIKDRNDSEKRRLDEFDLAFIKRKLAE